MARSRPRRSSARMWAIASATAIRRMKPSMRSHDRDHFMQPATSQAVSCPARIASRTSSKRCSWCSASSVEAGPEADEAVLVGRQHLVAVVGRQLLQREEEVAQRVVARLGVQPDVRRDPGQDVVAGQHQPVAGLPEAQVAGGVARRPDGLQVPPGDLGLVAVLQQDVGLHQRHPLADGHRGVGQALDLLRRRPPPPQRERSPVRAAPRARRSGRGSGRRRPGGGRPTPPTSPAPARPGRSGRDGCG